MVQDIAKGTKKLYLNRNSLCKFVHSYGASSQFVRSISHNGRAPVLYFAVTDTDFKIFTAESAKPKFVKLIPKSRGKMREHLSLGKVQKLTTQLVDQIRTHRYAAAKNSVGQGANVNESFWLSEKKWTWASKGNYCDHLGYEKSGKIAVQLLTPYVMCSLAHKVDLSDFMKTVGATNTFAGQVVELKRHICWLRRHACAPHHPYFRDIAHLTTLIAYNNNTGCYEKNQLSTPLKLEDQDKIRRGKVNYFAINAF